MRSGFERSGFEHDLFAPPSRRVQWDLEPHWSNEPTGWGSLQQMDQQMKTMLRDMDRMFEDFKRLRPASSFGQWREDLALQNPIISAPDGSKKFQLSIDLSHFKPEEIEVKTRDQMIEVHAKHEEKSENGQVFREYRRAFTIPKEVKPENLKSTLAIGGLLSLEAPVALPAIQEAREHVIPIRHE
jgi:HSP20 family molecular chaperone IbpA